MNELNTEIMKGQGLRIAVLDTAVNTEYVEVTDSVSFVSDKDSASSDILHGTYVANIIKKTLPDAEIFSAAILDKNGKGYYSTLIAGLKWAVRNKADIIVMSLGGEGYSNILREEILNAFYNDVLLFSAAGNTDHILYPAAYNETIAVGCLNRDSSVTFSYKDVNGKKIYADVYAPGEVYGINGTSGAAAFAAACAGILLNYDEHLSFEQVKALYINTGKAENREYSVLDVYSSVIYSRNPIYTRLSYADRTFSEIQEAEDEIDWELTEQKIICTHQSKDLIKKYGPHSSMGHEVYWECRCGQLKLLVADYDKDPSCPRCNPSTPTPTPKPTPSPKPTPKPTAEPSPSPEPSPEPVITPDPTSTPRPTATPSPTNSPKPSPKCPPHSYGSSYGHDISGHDDSTGGLSSKHYYYYYRKCTKCDHVSNYPSSEACTMTRYTDSNGLVYYYCSGCRYTYYPSYLLSYSVRPAGAGVIEGTPSGYLKAGSKIYLRARANEGYRFVRWESIPLYGGGVFISDVMPESDKSYTAVFEAVPAASNKTNQDSSKGGKGTNQEIQGDPVNVVTGNFYDEEDDLVVNTVGDLVLSVSRSYNSMNTDTGLLGKGWSLNFESFATIKNVNEPSDVVIVRFTDGRSMRFTKTKKIVTDGSERTVSGADLYGDFYKIKSASHIYVTPDKCKDILYKANDGTYVLFTEDRQNFVYDESGKLIKILDRNGNELSFSYNGDLLSSVTSSDGKKITFETKDGRITRATDNNGRYVTYSYTDGNLTRVSGNCLPSTTYTYNEYGLESIIDANGNTGVTNNYDCNGRVVRQWDSDGRETRIVYNDEDNENTYILVDNNAVTRYEYDKNLYITRINYADGTFVEYSYDADGNRIQARDRNGYKVDYEYDARGNMTGVTNSLGATAKIEYSASGDILKVTDAKGAETAFLYDSKGNLIEKHVQGENDDSVYRFSYDSKGHVIESTDALGNRTTYSYDTGSGSPKTATYPNGRKVTYLYDTLGRLIGTEDETGNTGITYNERGYVTGTTDEIGNTTLYFYDDAGNVVKVIRPEQVKDITLPKGRSYNDLTLNDVKNIPGFTYTYDGMGRMTSAKDPLGNTTDVTYDVNGEVTRAVLNRTENLSFEDAKGYIYTYDPVGNLTEVQTPNGGTTSFLYDGAGNIVRKTDALGNSMSYSYDPINRLTSVTDGDGNVLAAYVYDETGKIIKFINAEQYLTGDSNETRVGTLISYDLRENVTETLEPVKTENVKAFYRLTRFTYDANGQKTAEKIYLDFVDKDKKRINGSKISDKEAGKETDKKGGNVKNISGLDAWFVINYSYDTVGNIVLVSASDGSSITYSYDLRGNRTKEDVNGVIYEYSYDPTGNIVEKIDPYGGITGLSYDGNGNRTSVTLPEGGRTELTYDAVGNVIKKTEIGEAGGEETVKKAVTRSSTRKIRETAYKYDAFGNVTEITDALGNTTKLEYDDSSNLTKITDALKGVTTYSYDLMGNMTSETDPLGNTVSYTYDPLGRVTTVTDDESITSFLYDLLGRKTSITDPVGVRETYTYDFAGNVTEVKIFDKENSVKNKGNRKGTETAPVSHASYTYDVLGNLIAQTDALGNTTSYELDFWGNVIKETDALGNVTVYDHDLNGNITRIIDANGAVTNFTYDIAGRMSGITYPDDTTVSCLRDWEGRIVERLDRNGNRYSASYDLFGNLINETYEATRSGNTSETYNYVYDDLDRVIRKEKYIVNGEVQKKEVKRSVAQASDVIEYTYDALGRVTKKTQGGVDSYTVDLSYDKAGNVKSISSEELGYDVSYTYDRHGNILSVRDDITSDIISYTYLPDGMPESKTVSGLRTEYTYNALKEVLTETVTGDGVIYSEENTYDAIGNLIRQVRNDGTSAYGYDSLDRLVSETHSLNLERREGERSTDETLSITYTYDCMGNRILKEDSTKGTTNYVYDISNRLLEEVNGDTGTVYDYDLNGNVIGKSIANRNEKGSTDYTYSYSLSGLLTTVTKNGEIVQENVYDAENIRSGKRTTTDDGSAEEIFATLAGKLIAALRTENTNYPQEEWDEGPRKVSVKSLKSSNPYKRNFIYGNGLEKIGDFTAITNSHGDVKKLMGAKLETVAEYVYDTFGNLLNGSTINGSDSGNYTTKGSALDLFNDILYAGEQYDCVTETYYLRARMYSPSLGRFLEEDTYLGDGRNLYTYVSNNPVMFVDPSGYCKQDWNRVGEGTFKMVWGSVITSAGITSLIVVAEVLSGPVGWVALAISVGVGTAGALCVGFGVSDSLEGVQDVAKGLAGDRSASINVVRDYVFGGDQDLYNAIEALSVMSLDFGLSALEIALMFDQKIKSMPGPGAYTGNNGNVTTGSGQGYKTFAELKKAIGSAGEGKDWHHIVEQSQIEKSGFRPEEIHNVNNVIAIDHEVHMKITGYYNSKGYRFTNGLSVREWLVGQSFEEQYNFGLKVLKMFGVDY